MIDLHCHILPGVDDGPPDLPSAIALARATVATGTRVLAATPHVSARYLGDGSEIADRVAELTVELKRAGVALELRAGAEVALSRLDELNVEALGRVSLGGARWVLVESPHDHDGSFLEERVFALQTLGFGALMAHPERSPVFQRDPDRLAALVDRGGRCSITAGSLTGRYGRRARTLAIELLRRGLVHDVASDAHDVRRRPPGIGGALAHIERELPGATAADPWFTKTAPAALLDGRDPGTPPKLRAGRRWWRRRRHAH